MNGKLTVGNAEEGGRFIKTNCGGCSGVAVAGGTCLRLLSGRHVAPVTA